MKKLVGAFLVALLVPVAASAVTTSELLAQIAALNTQILALQQGTTGVSAAAVCDLPSSTLRRGSSGHDVSRLQEFLARDISVYPEASITGYFGPLTERAVQRWQAKYGVVSSGTPASTGYGVVGPKTLAEMKQSWCLQSGLAPSPFTPSPGSYVPEAVTPTPTPATPVKPMTSTTPTVTTTAGSSTSTPRVVGQPHIIFTAPLASTTVTKGGTLIATWQSDGPLGATVSISLQNKSGVTLGLIKSNLSANGSYYWTVPMTSVPASGSCTGDTITCLSQIAQSSNANCVPVCNVESGLYKLRALLLYGASEIANAESRIFSVGGAGLSNADIANTGTYWDFSATSSYAGTGQGTTIPSTSPSSVPLMCTYSGVPYSEGISVIVNCADVTAPGQACGGYGGMQLTCRSGRWVDPNGVAQNIPGVTNIGGSNSCTTPWNAQVIGNGQIIPRQPFFTNGTYSSGGTSLMMKCSSGSWLTCDTAGDQCH